jgi:hypothetical protein
VPSGETRLWGMGGRVTVLFSMEKGREKIFQDYHCNSAWVHWQADDMVPMCGVTSHTKAPQEVFCVSFDAGMGSIGEARPAQ